MPINVSDHYCQSTFSNLIFFLKVVRSSQNFNIIDMASLAWIPHDSGTSTERHCQLQKPNLFSPLGKLAERAIYFADVFSLFFYFFNGRPQSLGSSEPNGPIFTKISGLVDGCVKPGTHYPYIRAICTARVYGLYIRAHFLHPYIRAVHTARIYGWCVPDTRIYGP